MMVGGEAMQSGFHFALNLVLIHNLSAHDYGIFALAMVMGGVGLSYVRSLTAVPVAGLIGKAIGRRSAYVHEITFSSAALILTLLIGCLAATLLNAWGGDGALAGGCFVGLWAFRSHLRTCHFAHRQQSLVTISDLTFTLSGTLATGLVIWQFGSDLESVFWALALANVFGIVVLLAVSRRPLRVTARRSVRRRWMASWGILKWSAIGATTTNLQGQCLSILVATLASPTAYAPIAAIIVLFAPLRIISTAFANMMQTEVSALLAKRDTSAIWAQARTWTLLLGAGGLTYGAIVFALIPHLPAETLKDPSIRFIGSFAWAIFFLAMLYIMPRIILEMMGAFRTVALITGGAALFSVVSIVGLLAIASPPWSLAGAAVSEALVGMASWRAIQRRLAAVRPPDGRNDSLPVRS
jgi:O-antigen/teichoic acid export membrane protein